LPFRITSWRNFTVILDKLFTQTETLPQDFFPVAIQITKKKIACAATDSTRYSMTDPKGWQPCQFILKKKKKRVQIVNPWKLRSFENKK
jgi:hypothetical protein